MTLRVGEDKAIQPSLSPIGFLGEYSYQIDASSPADLVEIRDGRGRRGFNPRKRDQ